MQNDIDYYLIGQRIRKYRKANQLSQEDLAAQIYISTTHLSHIETGTTKLSLPVLVSIADALHVRADDLLQDDPVFVSDEVVNRISELLADCTVQEQKIILDVIHALQSSLRHNI